jgi:hypothetical protein
MIRDHDFHPPDDVRLFPMPTPGVLRLDDSMFVAVAHHGDIVLWHYAFRDHWFKINATTDLEGGLVETTAPDDVPPFAFNCDIATPMLRRGDAVLAVDLFLDMLVRSDGATYGVHDQQAFEDAVRRGWVSEREAAGASAGLQELLGFIESGLAGAVRRPGTGAPRRPRRHRAQDRPHRLHLGTRLGGQADHRHPGLGGCLRAARRVQTAFGAVGIRVPS